MKWSPIEADWADNDHSALVQCVDIVDFGFSPFSRVDRGFIVEHEFAEAISSLSSSLPKNKKRRNKRIAL